MLCYVEYNFPKENAIFEGEIERRFLYYDNNEIANDVINEIILNNVKRPSNCLDLSESEHLFLQKELSNIQKISYSQGMNVVNSFNTISNIK